MSSRISQKSPEDYSYDDDFEDDESSGIQSDLRVRRKSISSSSSLSNSKQSMIPKLSSHENEREERSIFNYKGNEREEYSLSSAKNSQKQVSISDSQKYEFAVQPKSRIFPSPSGRSIKSSSKNKIVSWIQKGKWTLGENIGKGSFGTVFQCMNNKGNFFAVKRIEMNSTRRESVDDLVREIDLMRGISHPNIVEYIGASVDEKNFFLYIFQEWVSGGSVAHLLKRFGPFKEGVVLNYTEQILKGLSYLHENGIVHRDIKGGNVLVASSGVVKLADFGASTKLDLGGTQELKDIKGTPYFMAPEVLGNNTYGRKGDIWAVGCTMVQMLTGEPPWKDRQLSGIVQLHLLIANWVGGPPPLSVPLEANGKIDTCLKLCFLKDPAARPSAVELLNLDIFSNVDDDDDELSGSISAFSSPENTLNFRTRSISRSTDGEASLANSGILSSLRDKMNRVVASCTSPASQLPSPARIGNSSFSPKTPKVNTLFGQNGNNYNYGNNTNNANNVNIVNSNVSSYFSNNSNFNQGRKANELSPDVFQEGNIKNNLTSAPSPFNKNNPFGRNRASNSNDSNRSSPTKEDQISPGFSNFNMDELCEPKEFVQLDNPFSTRTNQQRNTNSSSLIPSISSSNSINNSNSSINFSRGKNSNGKHTPIPECDEDIESDQSRKNSNYQQIQKTNSQKNNSQIQNQNNISTSEKSITSSCGSGKSGGSSPRYLSKAPSMISTNNLSLLPSSLSQIPSPSPEARSINSSREKRVRNVANNSTLIPSPVKSFSPNSNSNSNLNSNSNSPRNEQLIPPSSFSPMFSHRSQSKHNSNSNLNNQNNFDNDQFKNKLPRSAPSALGSNSSNYNSSNNSLNNFSNNFSNASLQNEGKVKSLLEFDNRLISPSRVDPITVNNISNNSNNSNIRNSTGISSLSTNRSIASNNTRSKSVNPSEIKVKQRASTADSIMVSSASEPQINSRINSNKNINLNNSLNSKDSSNNNNRISIMSFLSPQTSKRKTNSSDKLVPIRQSSAQSSQSNNNSNKSIIANYSDDNLDQTQTQWRCLKCSQNNTNPTHCIQCATVRGATGKRDNSAIILRK